MSNIGFGLTTASLRPALPVFSGLLGSLSLMGGLYSFSAPEAAAKEFGIVLDESSSPSVRASQTTFVQAVGLRNLVTGVSTLSILAFWQLSSICQASPVAEQTVKRILGIMLTVGTLVSMGDAYIISQYARVNGISNEAKELAKEKGMSHATLGVPILGLGLAYLSSSY